MSEIFKYVFVKAVYKSSILKKHIQFNSINFAPNAIFEVYSYTAK